MLGIQLHRLLNRKKIVKYFCQTAIATRNIGAFKRPILDTKCDKFSEIKNTYFCNRTELSNYDWRTVTELLINSFKQINENNVDAIVVRLCGDEAQLPLAKSYLRYLQANGKQPNDATLGKLLRVYNAVYHQKGGTNCALAKEEQEEILEVYGKLRSKHDILDSISCENLVYGLVATERWRECLQLLEMMKLSRNKPSLPVYTETIIKAISSNDLELGWQLLSEMVEDRKQPKCEIFLALLNTIVKKNKKDFYEEMEKLLTFLETHNILITQKVATALQDLALKHPNLLMASTTNLTSFGKCSSCGLYMKNISLSEEDFNTLQDSFLNAVLIRKDVFQKSTPQEVKQFCDYIERTGPYDCVIDGLNVAYSMGSKKPIKNLANLLVSVVKYFKTKNKHVLVMGRKHMNNWPKNAMQFIKANAAVFLTNDISQDDPFLLYATLKSGQCTDFFSRDFMRQHAFLLGPKLKVIFRRWQQEHQYSLLTQTESGKIIVKEPIRHLICTHKVENTWHIPYKMEFSPNFSDSYEKPEFWLCLKVIK